MTETKKRILIIEDEVSLAAIYKECLEEKEFTVALAESGEKGLACITDGGFDLILLDLMMPNLNGFELLKKLTPENKAHNGPIVILSVLSQEELVKRALQNGAQGYIMKSNTPLDQLVEKVREYVKK